MRFNERPLRKACLGHGVILVLALMWASCAPKQQVAVRQPAAGPPARTQAEVQAAQRAAPPSMDPSLIQREIQRRRDALSAARGRLEQSPGAGARGDQMALDSWIRATEEQVARLEAMRKELQGLPPATDASERAKRSQRMAEQLLECLALAPLDPPIPVTEARPRVKEETRVSWDILRSDYARGDCAAVLQEYRAVTGSHSGVAVPADVQLKRALCLSRSAKRREAIEVLEKLLAGGDQLVDIQQIQYHVANWLFEEGELDKAAQRYQSVLEGGAERDRWADLAKLRVEQIRLRKGEGLSPQPVERPREPTSGASLGGTSPAGSVANEKPPMPRPSGPETHERPSGPAAGPAPGEPPKSSAKPAEPGVSSSKTTETGSQEVQLAKVQEAQRLLEGEKYEEAIRAFQEVEGTDLEPQVKKGIQEAQDRYADKRRREAASLVLKAHGETPSGNRKALLVQALQILQETNARYPGNKHASKIEQNIKDVTQQIRKMDPEFRP